MGDRGRIPVGRGGVAEGPVSPAARVRWRREFVSFTSQTPLRTNSTLQRCPTYFSPFSKALVGFKLSISEIPSIRKLSPRRAQSICVTGWIDSPHARTQLFRRDSSCSIL